ncbi:hypothetical protein [Microbacterium sp. VKM Ac-2923]|uniref:hypothetical protein n=1 Tax=Microbacterium sp. VKM Ac-2923 TaxID=2929476 RepID=UPI001FB53F69|nr:hypothetical protein [Microbacterium sp. VKM Ac-2923]MCJ1707618.1 hypothetical protein [Microbacterium sp. VKM Ac-2923]
MPTDPVADVLNAAAPLVRFDVSARNRRATIRAARRSAGTHAASTVRLAVAAGFAVALVAGGGATAFAMSPELREWMAPNIEDPYVTIEYAMPSGAICTETWGDTIATDPEAAAALRAWVTSADVLTLIDIDAAMTHLRSEKDYVDVEVGSDTEYSFAMGNALIAAARDELERRGFPPGSIDSWSSEADCTTPAP